MEGGAFLIAFWSLGVGVLLLLVLVAVAVRGWLTSRETSDFRGSEDVKEQEACAGEFVRHIFSSEDWRYVREMRAPEIEKLFRRERRAVALVWVSQTSATIRQIMREHAALARQSTNLNPVTELKVLLQYAGLLTTCGAIRMGIDLAGPMTLGGLAGFAQKQVQRIGEAEQAFVLAMQERPGATN